MKVISQLKRQVASHIREIIAPHLWRSQYEGTMVFRFAYLDRANRDHGTRSMGRVFDQDLKHLQGFYTDGTIDAVGHGCACKPFEAYCVEDLLAIERWLNRNFVKELTRVHLTRAA